MKIVRVEAFHVDWGGGRPVHGKFVLSDAPGLGLEIDEDELRTRMIPWTSSAASA